MVNEQVLVVDEGMMGRVTRIDDGIATVSLHNGEACTFVRRPTQDLIKLKDLKEMFEWYRGHRIV